MALGTKSLSLGAKSLLTSLHMGNSGNWTCFARWEFITLITKQYMVSQSDLCACVFFFFFYSILRWSIAVSTMRRQSSRIAAFLQADARPMFCWPRSAFTAQSQVWLGLPDGRFQSGGSPWITAATARWWSSCGECGQYVQRAANVCQWPGGRVDGIQWLLWLCLCP